MSDNFVTCRHCGIGINYACDHEDDDVPKEEVAALRAENERLRAVAKAAEWVATDMSYRAPEQAASLYRAVWRDHLADALAALASRGGRK